MKARNLLFLALVLAFLPVAFAQPVKPKIKMVRVLGRGIAIDPSNMLQPYVLKIGVIRVKVAVGGVSKEIDFGLLFFDNERFRLKNIHQVNDTFYAELYQNNTLKGSINLTLTIKGENLIWVGKLTLNNKVYYAYVLEAKRLPKRYEIFEEIKEACKKHPEICKREIKGIGPAYCNVTFDENCREKIARFCRDHPNDRRCIAIKRVYCLLNLEDERCRQWIVSYCKKNPESTFCEKFKLKVTEKYCKKHPLARICVSLKTKRLIEYCLKNPEDPKCAKIKRAQRFLEKAYMVKYCIEHQEEEKCKEFCAAHPFLCRRIPSKLLPLAEGVNETIKKLVERRMRGILPWRR